MLVKEAVNTRGSFSAAFIFWPKLPLILCFPSSHPSIGGAAVAPNCLNFHLFECISAAGTSEARSPQVQTLSSLPLSMCPATPGLASGTNSPSSFLEAFELSSSKFFITSGDYPDSLQTHGHLRELCGLSPVLPLSLGSPSHSSKMFETPARRCLEPRVSVGHQTTLPSAPTELPWICFWVKLCAKWLNSAYASSAAFLWATEHEPSLAGESTF